MSALSLTQEQRRAVEARGKDLLVSAAAGSGKTSVLAQRVAALVEEGADIRKMLICTFTNLAAGEMRERIARALMGKGEAEGNHRLLTQAEYVTLADICTIHSFAIRVVRENFTYLKVPHDIRVCGAEEAQVLEERAMKEALRRLYEAEDENLTYLRRIWWQRTDAGLRQELFRLYAFVMSRPEGLGWLAGNWQTAGAARSQAYLVYRLQPLAKAQTQLKKALALAARQGWEEQAAVTQTEIESLALLEQDILAGGDSKGGPHLIGTVRGLPECKEKKTFQTCKTQARKALRELADLPTQVWDLPIEEQEDSLRQARAYHHVLTAFHQAYAALKAERGVMDYDQILHLALQALSEEEIAASYRDRYDHVFLDEYQDTNPLQEVLFARVAKPGSRFLVGDMKQSIYRFRMADPTLFLAAQDRLTSGGEVIHMNRNFRSVPGVTEVVNGCFARLMNPLLGELTYTAEEAMVPHRQEEGGTQLLLTYKGEGTGPHGETESAMLQEAVTIAQRILALLGETIHPVTGPRKTEADDIAILLRNNTYRDQLMSVLAAYGIPVASGGEIRDTLTDVEVFVDLLRLVDHDYSDISLLSVLKSHIGAFTEEELACIRAAHKEGAFFGAFRAYSQGEEGLAAKCREFLGRMEFFRTLASAQSLEELLLSLKNLTEYEAATAARPGGRERLPAFRAFFASLMEQAAREDSLFSLLRHLDDLKASPRSQGYMAPGSSKDKGQGVHILTIHGSKGLEFPVVILAHLDGQFNTDDLKRRTLLHPDLGLAAYQADPATHTLAPTLSRELVKTRLLQEMKSEELRVLYVAMTRAREKLILSGCIDRDKLDTYACPPSVGQLLDAKSPLEWVLWCMMQHPALAEVNPLGPAGEDYPLVFTAQEAACRRGAQARESLSVPQLLEKAAGRPAPSFLKWEHPPVPAKMGVSSLLPEYHPVPLEEGVPLPIGPGGKEVGTLIHLFLQHLDFHVRREEGLEAALQSLLDRQIVSPREGEVIRTLFPAITGFLQSHMGSRLRAAKEIYREVPFTLAVPARSIGQGDSDEKVLVQGIIDLVFRGEKGWVILDYKSNAVTHTTAPTLADHYRTQLDLYQLAWETVTREKVAERYLYFLRGDLLYEVM